MSRDWEKGGNENSPIKSCRIRDLLPAEGAALPQVTV